MLEVEHGHVLFFLMSVVVNFDGSVRYFADFEFSSIYCGFYLALNLIIPTFINARFAMVFIWRKESKSKGAEKNTSPNVTRLQYSVRAFRCTC